MKKLLSLIFIFLLLLSGCQSNLKSGYLDLKQLTTALKELKAQEFNYRYAGEYLSEKGLIGDEWEFVYDYDLAASGINQDFIARDNQQAEFILEKGEQHFIFIAKAKDERLKANLVDLYADDQAVMIGEYAGYIYAMKTKDNETALTTYKAAREPLLYNVSYLPKEESENTLGIAPALLDDALIALPTLMTQVTSVIVLKPKAGEAETVSALMKEYFAAQEAIWDTYLPDQAEILHQRLTTSLEGYLIYIVSAHNEEILTAVKACMR